MNNEALEYNSLMRTYSSVLDRHEEVYGVTGGVQKGNKIVWIIAAILILMIVCFIIWKVVL